MIKRTKLLSAVLATFMAIGTIQAQKHKNYYTQILHLTDSTEIRLLPDDIYSVTVINTNDPAHMTAGEYLKFGNGEGIDSIRNFYCSPEPSDVRIPYNYPGASACLPNNALWSDALPQLAPYLQYADKIAGIDIESMSSASSTQTRTLHYDTNYGLRTAFAEIVNAYDAKKEDIDYVEQVEGGTVTVLKNLPREAWYGDLTFADWEWRGHYSYSSKRIVDSTGVEVNVVDSTFVFGGVKAFGTAESEVGSYEDTSYAIFRPSGQYAKPDIFLRLPQTLSTTYDFYCTIVPESKEYDDTVTTARPNILNFQLYYSTKKGELGTYNFSSQYLTGEGAENPKTLNKTTAFLNDTTKTDTLYLGRFTFPVATKGINDSYYGISPTMRISTPISIFNKKEMATYTRVVRLANIIMRPVEEQ